MHLFIHSTRSTKTINYIKNHYIFFILYNTTNIKIFQMTQSNKNIRLFIFNSNNNFYMDNNFNRLLKLGKTIKVIVILLLFSSKTTLKLMSIFQFLPFSGSEFSLYFITHFFPFRTL